MMAALPALFWYKLVFMLELLVGEGLLTWKLRKRGHFALRVVVSVIACMAVCVLTPSSFYEPWVISTLFMTLFVLTMLALRCCYDEAWISILFCASVAYTCRHLAYLLWNLIVDTLQLSTWGLGLYGEGQEAYSGWVYIAYGFSYYVVYWLVYLCCGTYIESGQRLRIGSVPLLGIALLLINVTVVFNAVSVSGVLGPYDRGQSIMTTLYGMVSCILLLCLQFTLLDNTTLRNRLDVVELLWRQKRGQYEIAKETMDVINIKCHDLNHAIAALQGRLGDDEVSQLGGALRQLDITADTGNESLDVILTEKGMLCNGRGITLACNVDGRCLDMMSAVDLYSLFGNLLDNAIEAADRLELPDDRYVALSVRAMGGFVAIRCENRYVGEVTFRDGLPQTTKGDDRYHGFGVRSIERVVGRYDGNMTIDAGGGTFVTQILLQNADAGGER